MEQAFAEAANPMFKAKRILEINPHHDLFGRLQKLHEAGFSKLQLTHFGEVTDVSGHLARYAMRVEQVHECIENLLADGLRGDDLRAAYGEAEHTVARQAGVSEEDWQCYEGANSTAMCADGIALFCEKSKE